MDLSDKTTSFNKDNLVHDYSNLKITSEKKDNKGGNYLDKRISNGLSEDPQKLCGFRGRVQHKVNPEHIYCRVLDFLDFLGNYEYLFSDSGRNKKIAKFIRRAYGEYIYDGNGGFHLLKLVSSNLNKNGNR